MEADEDGRGLHLRPPWPSSTPSSTDDHALPTSGDSSPFLHDENLDEIDHQLGINFNHLLDIPFHQVPQHDTDNQTTFPHQIDLNLDALLSNAGTSIILYSFIEFPSRWTIGEFCSHRNLTFYFDF